MVAMKRCVVLTTLLAAVALPACREVEAASEETPEPYTVEQIEGTDLARVTVTADGAERIGLKTARVQADGDRLRVPASAVWIDVEGREWVYTADEPLVFVRAPVRVERYEADWALLRSGPASGTEIVTVGVAELIGSEFGI
jgi:hypothetical protein